MSIPRYNASIRNLTYRLRKFEQELPTYLEEVVRNNESAIISAVVNDQLYRRGVNGYDRKIMDYQPYAPSTIQRKRKKGQPSTRVTLRDTGDFHRSVYLVFDSDGFYLTSDDKKAKYLVARYGEGIFRLTDKNFTRILRSHIRKDLAKRLRQIARKK